MTGRQVVVEVEGLTLFEVTVMRSSSLVLLCLTSPNAPLTTSTAVMAAVLATKALRAMVKDCALPPEQL